MKLGLTFSLISLWMHFAVAKESYYLKPISYVNTKCPAPAAPSVPNYSLTLYHERKLCQGEQLNQSLVDEFTERAQQIAKQVCGDPQQASVVLANDLWDEPIELSPWSMACQPPAVSLPGVEKSGSGVDFLRSVCRLAKSSATPDTRYPNLTYKRILKSASTLTAYIKCYEPNVPIGPVANFNHCASVYPLPLPQQEDLPFVDTSVTSDVKVDEKFVSYPLRSCSQASGMNCNSLSKNTLFKPEVESCFEKAVNTLRLQGCSVRLATENKTNFQPMFVRALPLITPTDKPMIPLVGLDPNECKLVDPAQPCGKGFLPNGQLPIAGMKLCKSCHGACDVEN